MSWKWNTCNPESNFSVRSLLAGNFPSPVEHKLRTTICKGLLHNRTLHSPLIIPKCSKAFATCSHVCLQVGPYWIQALVTGRKEEVDPICPKKLPCFWLRLPIGLLLICFSLSGSSEDPYLKPRIWFPVRSVLNEYFFVDEVSARGQKPQNLPSLCCLCVFLSLSLFLSLHSWNSESCPVFALRCFDLHLCGHTLLYPVRAAVIRRNGHCMRLSCDHELGLIGTSFRS